MAGNVDENARETHTSGNVNKLDVAANTFRPCADSRERSASTVTEIVDGLHLTYIVPALTVFPAYLR